MEKFQKLSRAEMKNVKGGSCDPTDNGAKQHCSPSPNGCQYSCYVTCIDTCGNEAACATPTGCPET